MSNDPMLLLKQARDEAKQRQDLNAKYCTLATLDENDDLQPRMRTLVIRDIARDGCLLFVNAHAPKNLLSLDKSRVELLFFYPSLMTQFRLRGDLSLMSRDQLESHWQHKPYGSKLLDHFYRQDRPQSASIEDRETLIDGIERLKKKYPDPEDVPFTPDALGLLVKANYLEVWQGEDSGIHDRRLYTLLDENWHESTLVP